MRKFATFMSAAVLGSIATVWLLGQEPPVGFHLVAQDQLRGPTIPALPRESQSGEVPGFDPRWYSSEGLSPDEAINVAVYESCNRSVVNISTLGVRADRFFMLAVPEEGNGSGAVLDKAGHILTNFHVIENARQVNVTLYNEESYAAKLVGADPVNDIAVIKVDAPLAELWPVTFGDSGQLQVGMRVFALGNPFGLERSMSQGIISSLNRTLEVPAQLGDQVDHPNRRFDQSGEFRRSADRQSRSPDWDEYRDCQPSRPECRNRICNSGQPHRTGRSGIDRARARDSRRHRHFARHGDGPGIADRPAEFRGTGGAGRIARSGIHSPGSGHVC